MKANRMKVAVVGHVEWVSFLRVDRAPAAGMIAHASEAWDEPAGGGGVVAVEMARLAGAATFFTALGNDAFGERSRAILKGLGVEVRARARDEPTRRAVTLLDPAGERTIIVIGSALAPRVEDQLGIEEFATTDAVYFCKGDAAMLRAARRARTLVATARILPILKEAGVELDALVYSARDEGEKYTPGELDPPPRLAVGTEGGAGGFWRAVSGEHGRWSAAPLVGNFEDSYGAGDSFAAGLAYALAEQRSIAGALDFAASRGALALSRKGAHGG
jgi:ribokinase